MWPRVGTSRDARVVFEKSQYNLWVLNAVVVAAAVLLACFRIVASKNWQATGLPSLALPIVVAEWGSMCGFLLSRNNNRVVARFFAKVIYSLSAILVVLSAAALTSLAIS